MADPAAPATVTVHVRYFAGARAATGVREETVTLADDGNLHASTVITMLVERHTRLDGVVQACSFLLDGVAVRDHSVPVADGATMDVLPPFAGG